MIFASLTYITECTETKHSVFQNLTHSYSLFYYISATSLPTLLSAAMPLFNGETSKMARLERNFSLINYNTIDVVILLMSRL